MKVVGQELNEVLGEVVGEMVGEVVVASSCRAPGITGCGLRISTQPTGTRRKSFYRKRMHALPHHWQ
jgi:hypothetical protein